MLASIYLMSILTQRLPYYLEFLEFRSPAMVLIRKSVVVVRGRVVGVLLIAILWNIFMSSGLKMSCHIRFLLGDGEGLACGILGPAMLVILLPFLDHLLIKCAVRIGVSLPVENQWTRIYI